MENHKSLLIKRAIVDLVKADWEPENICTLLDVMHYDITNTLHRPPMSRQEEWQKNCGKCRKIFTTKTYQRIYCDDCIKNK